MVIEVSGEISLSRINTTLEFYYGHLNNNVRFFPDRSLSITTFDPLSDCV